MGRVIRNVNGVVVSDHMVKRLGEVAQAGEVATGCQNCRNLTYERLTRAGLMVSVRPGVYALTTAGVEFLADVIGGRR